MQIHPTQRNVVNMADIGMTTQQLWTLFPDATWNNAQHAWRVANTLFVCPRFTLTDLTINNTRRQHMRKDIRNRIARGVEEHLLTVQNMTGDWSWADTDFIAEAQVAVQVAFALGVLTTSDDDICAFLVECGFTPEWTESFVGDDGAIY